MTKPGPCDPDPDYAPVRSEEWTRFLQEIGQLKPSHEPRPGLCQLCRFRPTDPSTRIGVCSVCCDEQAERSHYREAARRIIERIAECPYPSEDELAWLLEETTQDLIDLPLLIRRLEERRQATQETSK